MNHLLLDGVQNNVAEVIANLLPGEVVAIVSDNQIVAQLVGKRKQLVETSTQTTR